MGRIFAYILLAFSLSACPSAREPFPGAFDMLRLDRKELAAAAQRMTPRQQIEFMLYSEKATEPPTSAMSFFLAANGDAAALVPILKEMARGHLETWDVMAISSLIIQADGGHGKSGFCDRELLELLKPKLAAADLAYSIKRLDACGSRKNRNAAPAP